MHAHIATEWDPHDSNMWFVPRRARTAARRLRRSRHVANTLNPKSMSHRSHLTNASNANGASEKQPKPTPLHRIQQLAPRGYENEPANAYCKRGVDFRGSAPGFMNPNIRALKARLTIVLNKPLQRFIGNCLSAFPGALPPRLIRPCADWQLIPDAFSSLSLHPRYCLAPASFAQDEEAEETSNAKPEAGGIVIEPSRRNTPKATPSRSRFPSR